MYTEKFDTYVSKMRQLQTRVLVDDVKYHRHHIVPRFMGGTDNEDNIVSLTISEHVSAHLELADCFPVGSDERNKNLCSANVTNVWLQENRTNVNMVGQNNPMWGKKHRPSTLQKIGEKSSQKVFDDQYREKLRVASSGTNNPMWGRKHSTETRRKISDGQVGEKGFWYGKRRPTDTRSKISESQPHRIQVEKCSEDGTVLETYSSLSIASKENNIQQGNLSVYLRKPSITKYGRVRTLGGFVWRLKE